MFSCIIGKKLNWKIRIDGGQTMEYKDYIKQGLNGNAPLKLILCGNIQGTENDNASLKKAGEHQ